MYSQDSPDLEALEGAFDGSGLTGWDWALAGGIFAASIVLAILAKMAVSRVISRRADGAVADLVGNIVGYLLAAFGLIYALEQVNVRVGPLLGALGVVGIALAFALRDILENFVAGMLLQFRRPFSYGDQIISGETEGTVLSIDSRSVQVRTPDGETVYVPNSQVITDAIVNHTAAGARRTSVPIGVAYGTDLKSAQRTFFDATVAVEGVHSSPEPEVLLTGFGDSSVDFVVRFWHDPSIADHWSSQSDVAFALDRACKENGIEIPFPQRVIHRPTEG